MDQASNESKNHQQTSEVPIKSVETPLKLTSDVVEGTKLMKQVSDEDKSNSLMVNFFYYITKSIKYKDIKEEFTKSTEVLVDGDALVSYCILNENWSSRNGGEILHAVYLVERVLQMYLERGGKLSVVFFQYTQRKLSKNPMHNLLREVLICHLQKFHSKFNCDVHTNFFCPRDAIFINYVQQKLPSLFLTLFIDILKLSSIGKLFIRQVHEIYILGLNVAFLNYSNATASGIESWYLQSNCRKSIKGIDFSSYSENIPMKFEENVWTKFTKFKSIQLECYAAYTHYNKRMKNTDLIDFIKAYILYVLIKDDIPLKKRALPLQEGRMLEEIRAFQITLAELLYTLRRYNLGILNESTVCDIWDGNLFLNIYFQYKSVPTSNEFGNGIKQKWKEILFVFGDQQLLNYDPNALQEALVSKKRNEHPGIIPVELVPIQSELLESYAGDIMTDMDVLAEDKIKDFVMDFDEFKDCYHWHCNKFIIKDLEDLENLLKENHECKHKDEKDEHEIQQMTKFEKKKEREKRNRDEMWRKRNKEREEAKYFKFLEIYGQSLGDFRKPPPIVCQGYPKKGKKEKQVHQQQVNKKTIKGKEKIIAEKQAKEEKKLHDDDEVKFNELKSDLKSLNSQDALSRLISSKSFFKTKKYRVQWYLVLFKRFAKCFASQIEDGEEDNLIRDAFLYMKDFHNNNDYLKILNDDEKNVVASCLHTMGFVKLQKLLFPHYAAKHEKNMTKCHIEYQMKYMGHLLPKHRETTADSRVPHFIPDQWQRQLFNVIDRNQSALIVAPTSSGKTYASFYCMEKVLRQSNDDVVVYVSPTKALVNQVRAYIYNKIHKPGLPAGTVVCGVFTRDYRINVENCQILVTVPQCLEILLLSADSYDWSCKIKYVIFDEIHCIGSEGGGEVWEHLLCLISCPILALSATIGNPDSLHRWLQSIQDYQRMNSTKLNYKRPNDSYKVCNVVVESRHSDLQHFQYDAGSNVLEAIHPFGTVRSYISKGKAIPDHISLSPIECLQLYEVMKLKWPNTKALEQLHPEVYFEDVTFLNREDVRRYEKDLTKEFGSNINKLENGASVEKNEIQDGETVDSKIGVVEHFEKQRSIKSGPKSLIYEFVKLLFHLQEEDLFPVIVFSLNRAVCRMLVDCVVKYFEAKEGGIFAKRKQKDLSSAEKQKRKKEKDSEDTNTVNPKEEDDFRISRRKEFYESVENFWLDHEFCPAGGTFAGVASREDLKFIHDRLVRSHDMKSKGFSGMKSKDFQMFMKGIRYGISYHHAGMNSRERGTVEILFRMKFLKIVVATSTLAVGIHVPCRSVVIAGYNMFLDQLNFRQMSGRSGRRGFDDVGNVIFYNVDTNKVNSLMSGELTSLLGNYPMSVSLCLRVMILVAEVRTKGRSCVKAKDDTITRVLNLLENPLILQHKQELSDQFKYFFLFSAQFLVREGLLKVDGKPQGLAGVASHLYYHEPYNFFFISCIYSGAFHKYCRQDYNVSTGSGCNVEFSKMFMMDLLMVLSHFFGRKELLMNNDDEEDVNKYSTSVVKLQELPNLFKMEAEKYNSRVERVYNMYLQSISKHVERKYGEDVTLPVSKVKFKTIGEVNEPEEDTILERLYKESAENTCCSSFAALSGHKDNTKLYKPTDQITNVRHQIYTDTHDIPVVEVEECLNSYALDFYKHENFSAIVEENLLKEGEAFRLLKDFKLVLMTIAASMELFAPEDDLLRQAFRQLSNEFNQKFTL